MENFRAFDGGYNLFLRALVYKLAFSFNLMGHKVNHWVTSNYVFLPNKVLLLFLLFR